MLVGQNTRDPDRFSKPAGGKHNIPVRGLPGDHTSQRHAGYGVIGRERRVKLPVAGSFGPKIPSPVPWSGRWRLLATFIASDMVPEATTDSAPSRPVSASFGFFFAMLRK